jgi:sulfate adenylyltransferase subunit 2
MNARVDTSVLSHLSNRHLDAGRRNHLHPARSGRRFERPTLLFSGGKDSLVMLRCAEKAFGAAASPIRC